MSRTSVLDSREIADGTCKIINVEGKEIGVFRIGDAYFALGNWCAHQGGPVCAGKVTGTLTTESKDKLKFKWVREGEILSCPWHGLEYDIKSGQCLAFKEYRLRCYAVKAEKGKIRIEI